ncbi:hypothetical protein [Pyrodictium occultum]|uniref:hypothetical protein n=1 Tax=Pyrodictium occultum TaxID=2309 RepID=UPI001442E7B1|nr:hypothetical protein [Pyrodictium occultum]
MAAVRHVVRRLQRLVNQEYPRLADAGTCGHEFLGFVDALEREADREMASRGFEKLPSPAARERRDLVLGWYRGDGFVVELGLQGLNRCGVLRELTGGEPPHVYARFYIGGQAAFVIEAGKEEELAKTTYII